MNDSTKEARHEGVHRALSKSAHSATRRGPGQWDLALKNGEILSARAWLEEEWLHLAADTGDAAGTAARTAQAGASLAWSCLQRNGTLPGAVKYALDPQARLQIRAETPLLVDQTETDIRARVAEICEGIQAASHQLRNGAARKRPPRATREAAQDDNPVDLGTLCGEAGWPFTERSSGKLAVALDAADGFYQATLECRSEGVHVSAGLGTLALTSEDARAAVAVLLLTLNGVVRMVRAAAEACDGQSALRLEVRLGRRPAAGELGHALSALSVGCRLCAREAEVLEDRDIAAEYLALRGVSP
jgi:hypothetical protein